MFMGLSKKYASSIPLVMSCQTLAISAQFHVVFDDWFTTVQSSGFDNEVPEWWATLFQGQFRYDLGSDDPIELHESWLDEEELAHRSHEEKKRRVQALGNQNQKEPPARTQQKEHSLENESLLVGPKQKERLAPDSFDRLIEKEKTPETQNRHQDMPYPTPSTRAWPKIQNNSPPTLQLFDQEVEGLRRGARQRQPVKRLIEGNMAAAMDHMVHVCETISNISNNTDQARAYTDFLRFNPDSGEYDPPSMSAFVASKSNPDTLRYHEAMMDNNAEGFREAMAEEIKTLKAWANGTTSPDPRETRSTPNTTRSWEVLGRSRKNATQTGA
jgi:hypothetical protein